MAGVQDAAQFFPLGQKRIGLVDQQRWPHHLDHSVNGCRADIGRHQRLRYQRADDLQRRGLATADFGCGDAQSRRDRGRLEGVGVKDP